MPNTITDTITELADNKSDIQDALVAKGVTSAGKHGFNKFAEDIASITNQYASSDEGKVVSSGELVAQTSTTATTNGTIDTTTNNEVVVNVPNSYTAQDEGKVVSNGALVAQTAYPSTITANNTYDTTNYNSVTVNVGGSIAISALTTTMPMQQNDMYIFNGNEYSYIIGTLKIDSNSQTEITFTYDTSFTPTHTTKSRMWVKYGTSTIITSFNCTISSNTVTISTTGSSTYFLKGVEYALAVFLTT